MNWLARLKTWVCCWFALVEFCHRCGRRMPLVWWCKSDKLWQRVAGKYTCLCPRCFDVLASEQGIVIQWIAKKHRSS